MSEVDFLTIEVQFINADTKKPIKTFKRNLALLALEDSEEIQGKSLDELLTELLMDVMNFARENNLGIKNEEEFCERCSVRMLMFLLNPETKLLKISVPVIGVEKNEG